MRPPRLQAARSLCTLLRMEPQSAPIRAAWIEGVLGLAHDQETSVTKKKNKATRAQTNTLRECNCPCMQLPI